MLQRGPANTVLCLAACTNRSNKRCANFSFRYAMLQSAAVTLLSNRYQPPARRRRIEPEAASRLYTMFRMPSNRPCSTSLSITIHLYNLLSNSDYRNRTKTARPKPELFCRTYWNMLNACFTVDLCMVSWCRFSWLANSQAIASTYSHSNQQISKVRQPQLAPLGWGRAIPLQRGSWSGLTGSDCFDKSLRAS